ncbi:MAG TPA: tetratricopeptide repeat protein [Longimicrobiales bacterium]|nr:tetratricopeptide repeat protein [Longimicrobiales bacterium]
MKRIVAVVMLSGLVAACDGNGVPDDQATGSVDSAAWERARSLPADVQAALDSGNAAFRRDDFAAAREHYLHATQLGPDQSAAWFGLSMAERELGNVEAAEQAMQRVQSLAPGASLVHPDTLSADSLPAGHP